MTKILWKKNEKLMRTEMSCSFERMISILLAKNESVSLFDGGLLEHCPSATKNRLLKKLKKIKAVSDLRETISNQCLIGILGPQNSGKTTLINKAWSLNGNAGRRIHTTTIEVYPILQSDIYVVDYPGTNSLDSYAKSFSKCGAMNNIIVVITPDNGDIDEDVIKLLWDVSRTSYISNSSRLIVCFNKASFDTSGIPNQAGEHGNAESAQLPAEIEAQNYLETIKEGFQTLNDKKKNSKDRFPDSTEIRETTITLTANISVYLTDWLTDRSNEGILGAEAIKAEIEKILHQFGIID